MSSPIEQTISESALLAPYNHIATVPGKNFRGKMIDAFNLWLKVVPAKVEIVNSVVTKLHTSSLVIDDIEDNSTLRRGIPVAHEIFGIPSSINSANMVYFLAMQEAQTLVTPDEPQSETKFRRVMEIFADEMCTLHRGQGRDILFRENQQVPTEAEYMHMVESKTGGLFRLAVGILGLFSVFDGNFTPLLNKMGGYFQILDDYLNLQSKDYHASKTFCEDITEGKYSFPIIHSLNIWGAKKDNRLHNILRKCTESVELKQYAVDLMKETGSFAYTRDRLDELFRGILEEIETLGGNEPLRGLIQKLHLQTEDTDDEQPSPTRAGSMRGGIF